MKCIAHSDIEYSLTHNETYIVVSKFYDLPAFLLFPFPSSSFVHLYTGKSLFSQYSSPHSPLLTLIHSFLHPVISLLSPLTVFPLSILL